MRRLTTCTPTFASSVTPCRRARTRRGPAHHTIPVARASRCLRRRRGLDRRRWRPSDRWNREAWPGKQVALSILGARIANRLVLAIRLDALGDDEGSELMAEVYDDRDELLLAGLSVEVLNEVSIELDHSRL